MYVDSKELKAFLVFKMSVYVLKLIQNRYYVGKSQNVIQRVQQHKDMMGSIWTKIYPMICLVETLPLTEFAELSTTLRYMKAYGIQNVRGDVYSNVNLSSKQIKEIEQHIRHEYNLCLECGSDDHFVARCPIKSSWWSRLCCFRSRRPPNEYPLHVTNGYDQLLGSEIVDFGKYKGLTYETVRRDYPAYCKWILKQDSNSARFNRFKEYCSSQ